MGIRPNLFPAPFSTEEVNMDMVDLLRPLLTYDINRLDNRDPVWFARFFTALEPVLKLYFKPVVRGLERIPGGGGLYVGNHSGGLMTVDSWRQPCGGGMAWRNFPCR